MAIIGAGYWGTKLVNEYLALSKKRQDVALIAVVDKSTERLSSIGESLHLDHSILRENYDEVMENPEINAVHIATPNESHFEIASKAIAAGKHILLEKPMCLTSSDAFKLARSAEKKNLVLLIGHIFRFNNAINKIKELIEEKKIDGIRTIELRWTSLIQPLPNRDIIFDLAPHPVDILNHILEEWPTKTYVKAKSYERKRTGFEEIAFATFDFPEGVTSSVTLSWLHHGPRERTVNIVNKKCTIKVEAVDQRITIFEGNQTREIPVQRNNTIEDEITHFVDRIKSNDPPINSALTGVMNVTILESMKQSMEQDRVVSTVGR